MEAEILHRIQFAFTLTFHYIYPPMSIGLGVALIIMEGMYLKTRDPIWERLTKFWVKVFAMTFALGVVTGIPLQFSLGMNWARYSRFVGDIFGSLVGAEGFFAFLIEAGFLGILLFGWDRVKPRVHFLATIGVCLGAHFSAIWITSANSWMHSPTGYTLVTAPDGVTIVQVADWWEAFLSPLNLTHLGHVLLGAWLTGAFLLISMAAYYFLKKRYIPFAKRTLTVGLIIASVSLILQLISADTLSRKVSHYNPEKFAALEGVYKTESHTPAYIMGWVDTEEQKVHGISIPGLLSFMTYRDATQAVPGLEEFPKDEWPKVAVVFQVYHLMVLMWLFMTIAATLGLWMLWKKKWKPLFLKLLVISVIFPHLANIAGWYTSCIGRQPWSVYKLLKTSESYSLGVTYGEVVGSLIMFVVLYLSLFLLFLFLLDRKIKAGPEAIEDEVPYRST